MTILPREMRKHGWLSRRLLSEHVPGSQRFGLVWTRAALQGT